MSIRNNSRKNKKQVLISDDVAVVRSSACREDSSQEEVSFWYTRREIQKMRKSNIQDTSTDGEKENVLGPLARRDKQRKFIRGLLDLQAEHREFGMNDPRGLQVFSSASSKHARSRARETAIRTEIEVFEIYRESFPEDSNMDCMQKSAEDSCQAGVAFFQAPKIAGALAA